MKQMQVSMLVVLGVLSVIAAPSKKMKESDGNWGLPYQHAIVEEASVPEIPLYTEAEFNEELKQATKRGKREIAAVSAASLEGDFVIYRDRVLALKDTPGSSKAADEFDAILFELEQDGQKSAALQFFAAQMTPLRSFRGFFHKVRPLAKSYPIIQSYLVTMAKQMASNVDVFLTDADSQHMKVIFRYISEPYKYNTTRKEKVAINYKNPDDVKHYGIYTFNSEADIQNWLMSDVVPRLKQAIGNLNKISLKDKVVVWDNKLIAGTESYKDNNDRFRTLGEAERNSVLSNYYGNLSNIHIFCSYSATGLLSLVRQLGFLYGMEQMDIIGNAKERLKYGTTDVVLKGASAEERRNKIVQFLAKQDLKNGEHKLFTLLPTGKKSMSVAYANSLASNAASRLAWNELSQRKDDDALALDGGIFRPFTKVANKSLASMTSVLTGNLTPEQIELAKKDKLTLAAAELEKHYMPIRSAISGDVIQANAVKFFFAPPTNLAEFLPQGFNKEPFDLASDVTDPKGNEVRYRNYFKGTAQSWDQGKFQPYFKMNDNKAISNSSDIKTILRVTNQSWGGLMVGMTLTSILL
jgi:hypothetical protein